MTPERWQRVKQIFEAALERPPEGRAACLLQYCGTDAELRREVESLLASHGEADGFLEHHALGHDNTGAEAMPERFGRYDVEGLLGRGGMGVVYLARDPSLNRTVAIKVLSEAFARDRERLARFTREARLLAALNHPNIAAIYSFEAESGGAPFLVLEHVEGITLSEKLREMPLPLEQALSVGLQVARALEAAHERGVVHRDLKPDNIRVTSGGLVKVLDFGLARTSSEDPQRSSASFVTEAGRLMGTPGYMSPEQARGTPVDARSDIFAFGCVLYACLAGDSPFARDNAGEAIAALLKDEPDLEPLAGFPEPLIRLVRRCLSRQADERPQAAREVRAELEALLASSGGAAVSLIVGPGHVVARPGGSRHRLPRQFTSFIGRERELSRTRELLQGATLLTLTGAGGCGKTRLALRLAESMAADFDAMAFVELGPLHDPALVPAAVASALGVKEEAARPLTVLLAGRLCVGRQLLILDNCEHVLDAAGALIAALLKDCPQLTILSTSRESLGITGETTFRVPSLEVPAAELQSATAAAETEAVRLFVERAKAANPDFELSDETAPFIASICRRLDGIPLAIELAAARARVLSVEQIQARLHDRFRLLVGGSRTAVERHQTLRAALDWSYGLLSEPERRLLRLLSVFSGGFTLEAVLAVCTGEQDGCDEFEVLDLLTHLVDKSLVSMDDARARRGESPRYRLLETVRQYARERLQLDAGEAEVACSRHLDHYVALAERAEQHLHGPEQALWLQRLDGEHENLVSALEWSNDRGLGDDERGLRLAGALGRFWGIRGHFSSGRTLVQATLASMPGNATAARAKALNALGSLAYFQGDSSAAGTAWDQALQIQRALGNQQAIAGALNNLGLLAEQHGNLTEAQARFEEAMEINQTLGNRMWEAKNLNNLGNIAWSRGDYPAARVLYERALHLNRALGNRATEALNLANLATVAGDQGHYAEACRLHEEALAIQRSLGDRRGVADSLGNLSLVLGEQGSAAEAARAQHEALSVRRQLEDLRGIAASLSQTARLALLSRNLELFARMQGAAMRVRSEINAPLPPSDAAREERESAKAKSKLGPDVFERLLEAGRTTSRLILLGEAERFLADMSEATRSSSVPAPA